MVDKVPDAGGRHRSASPPAYGLWVNGRQVAASSGAIFERADPFDGTIAAVFANGDETDAEAAIQAARSHFDRGEWPRTSARKRAGVINRAARLLAENASQVADCMVAESGKPVTVAYGEIESSIRMLEYYAGVALDLGGEAVTERVPDALGLVIHEPVGVAGLITPWNFPILNPVSKIAPALAVGCTVVLKPSHLCSGPSLLFAKQLSEAGLPPGALNVVTSDIDRGAVVGQVIAGSPLVDKIAFTGSTATGQAVMRAAATNTKRISLELGGKSANIVFDDAPFEEAVVTSVRAFCFNSGQQCSAGTRLLIQNSIHDRFVDALVKETRAQILGDPADRLTTMGPLVNQEQFRKVMGYIDLGNAVGELVTGGGPPQAHPHGSLFVEPTVFDRVDNSSRLAQEEVFGPVLAVLGFDSEEEAVRLANESRYGLAGGVWTRSISRAVRVSKSVRTGKMFVNCYNNSGLEDLPHGGYKESGIGREQGRIGINEFQQVKTVHIRIES